MILCKTDAQLEKVFQEIKEQGFQWHTPMFLDSDASWDDTDIPQVETHCPNCRLLTDRNFNCTNTIDGKQWVLHHCLGCEVTWFDADINGSLDIEA
jgi:hypothetical protein